MSRNVELMNTRTVFQASDIRQTVSPQLYRRNTHETHPMIGLQLNRLSNATTTLVYQYGTPPDLTTGEESERFETVSAIPVDNSPSHQQSGVADSKRRCGK